MIFCALQIVVKNSKLSADLPRQQANLGPILGQYWCQLVARHPASDATYQLSDIILAAGNKNWICTIDKWNMFFFHSEVEECLQVLWESHFTRNHGERKFCFRLFEPATFGFISRAVTSELWEFCITLKTKRILFWDLRLGKFFVPWKIVQDSTSIFSWLRDIGPVLAQNRRPVSWPDYRCR